MRTMNCLRRSNIATVGELIGKGPKELLKLRNFGQKSFQEIEDRLASIGLSLTPKVEQAEEEPEVAEEEAEEPKPEETGVEEEPGDTGEADVSDEPEPKQGEPTE